MDSFVRIMGIVMLADKMPGLIPSVYAAFVAAQWNSHYEVQRGEDASERGHHSTLNTK